MNVGIIGLPQVGKKTLFKLLVGAGSLDRHTDPNASVRGVAEVDDKRFDRLVEMYEPRKESRPVIPTLGDFIAVAIYMAVLLVVYLFRRRLEG